MAASCSSAGRASILAFSFLFSFSFSLNTLWGLPIWLHRITAAPLSTRYLMVGSAPRMRFSSVILVPVSLSMGTLKSTRTSTFFPLTETSSMVFFITHFSFSMKNFEIQFAAAAKKPQPTVIIYHLYRIHKRFCPLSPQKCKKMRPFMERAQGRSYQPWCLSERRWRVDALLSAPVFGTLCAGCAVVAPLWGAGGVNTEVCCVGC